MAAPFYSPSIVRLSENTMGRDFIVGDLHGAFDVLKLALQDVKFNTSQDRLFIVGDLVDRGAYSYYASRLLAKEWVYSVRGNHEDMFLELYEDSDTPDPAIVNFVCSRNGMDWWLSLDQNSRMETLQAFRKLPLVYEVPTPRGLVGILHAEVPQGMSWEQFKTGIESGSKRVIESALWGRTRFTQRDESGVRGIDRLFVGHTVRHEGIQRLGNVYGIDTGAVFAMSGFDGTRLSFADLACETQVLCTPKPNNEGLIDLRGESSGAPRVSYPFGKYSI
ncbi:metallophosphoesterase [Candidatus Saccharibacteria bacterium]|nr:metallophosphoesterase [Candidatus Saccharibacteria bacterium]|tara:strand:- start:791 stop:1621 length:831 start_codon:yes stop_codon:yes gene_type:complete